MKNATIKFLLPNAFPISKTGFYNEIQAPKGGGAISMLGKTLGSTVAALAALWQHTFGRGSTPHQKKLAITPCLLPGLAA